jgi:hypothetical protein
MHSIAPIPGCRQGKANQSSRQGIAFDDYSPNHMPKRCAHEIVRDRQGKNPSSNPLGSA